MKEKYSAKNLLEGKSPGETSLREYEDLSPIRVMAATMAVTKISIM